MKKRRLILSLHILIIAIFLVTSTEAQNQDIKITEIMFDPPNIISGQLKDEFRCANDPSCQWIEVYNNEEFAVDLSSWKIRVETKTEGTRDYDFSDFTIQPKSFLVIATQLEDEDQDGFSLARLYGDKDSAWGSDADMASFNAVDSNIPFFATPDLFSGLNTYENIELKDESGNIISSMLFFSYYTDPIDVQKNNGYTMERDINGKYVKSMQLGGSPGKKRNSPPQFSAISNITIKEDYNFDDEVLNITSSQRLDLRNYTIDADGDGLTFQVIQQSSPSLISCQAVSTQDQDSQSFIKCSNPAQNQYGSSTITLEASDGLSTSNSQFTIFISSLNDPPKIISHPQSAEVIATTQFQYQMQSEDPENNTIRYSLIESPQNTNLNSSSGLLTFTPNEAQVGIHKFNVSASDSAGSFTTQEFEVKVKPILEYQDIILKINSRTISNPNNTQAINLIKTNQNIEISLTVVNNHPRVQDNNVPLEDMYTAITLSEGQEIISQDYSKKEFNLDSLVSKQENFSIAIPRILEEGRYDLEIKTTAVLVDLDENLKESVEEKESSLNLVLEISKNRHDVYIAEIKEVQQPICTGNTTLEIRIENAGTAPEQDIVLKVFNETLNLSQEKSIPRLNPGQSYTAGIEFENIPGTFDIQASITYNDGKNSNSKNFVSLPCIIGDFNRDNCINDKDSSLLSQNLRSRVRGQNSIYDLNSDSVIDFNDFFIFSDSFGKGCLLTAQQEQQNQGQTPVVQPPIISPVIIGTGITVPQAFAAIVVQGTSSSVKFQITNNNGENSTLVSFGINGLLSDSLNSLSFLLPQSKNILPNSTETFTLAVTAPSNIGIGDYIGTLETRTKDETITSDIKIQVVPRLCNSGIIGDLEVAIHDPDKNEKFSPGEDIPIDFSVRNVGQKKEVSAEVIIYNLDEKEEIESETIDNVDIGSLSSERDDFETEITLPDDKDIGSDDIVIIIKVFEKNGESTHCTQQMVPIRIETPEDEIVITSFDFPQQIQCNSDAQFLINVKNLGDSKEEHVYITLENEKLGINLKSNEFDLEDVYESKNTKSQKFLFSIPEVQEGQYNLEAKVFFDKGSNSNSETKALQIECEKTMAKIVKTTGTVQQQLTTAETQQEKNVAFEISKILSIVVASLIAIGSIKLLLLNSTKL